MRSPAPVLLVFGRGVVPTGRGHALTAASEARVRAAVDHVLAYGWTRVVFTGGWPEASAGMPAPPVGQREGDLMLRAARAAGLHRLADLRVETRSRSTLENLLHTVEDQLLSGYAFDEHRPLGLVSHAWHLPRVRFLVGKVLGLRGPALLDVPAVGGEEHDDRVALLAARVGFLGVRHGGHLLRRERRMVATVRLARQMVGRRPGRVQRAHPGGDG